MSRTARHLFVYLALAQASGRRQRPFVRDRLLALAGAIAAEMEMQAIAAYCRHLVLAHNPGHQMRRWATLREATDDLDFLHLLASIERRYPIERAETLLERLGLRPQRDRLDYASDEEFAASLLDTTWPELQKWYEKTHRG
jgi:hypothetical protein